MTTHKDALRKALEARDRAKKLPVWDGLPHTLHVEIDAIFSSLDALAAQPEQQPVAHARLGKGPVAWFMHLTDAGLALPQGEYDLYASPIETAANEGWISVEDRLPEPETDVLVRVLRSGSTMGYTVAGIFHDEWASYETQCKTKGEVTHWKPIDPPQENK